MQYSGAKVKALREARGMTQHQVARAVDVRDLQVKRWENGSQPGGVNMVRLLRTLGAELEEVVDQ